MLNIVWRKSHFKLFITFFNNQITLKMLLKCLAICTVHLGFVLFPGRFQNPGQMGEISVKYCVFMDHIFPMFHVWSSLIKMLCFYFRSDAHSAAWSGLEIQDQHQGPFPRIWPVSSRSGDRHHQRDAASVQVGPVAQHISYWWCKSAVT